MFTEPRIEAMVEKFKVLGDKNVENLSVTAESGAVCLDLAE